jgi:transposase
VVAVDPVGTAGASADSPTGHPVSPVPLSPIVEVARADRKASPRTLQQPLLPKPNRPLVPPDQATATAPARPEAAATLRRAGRLAEQTRREAEGCARRASLPVQHEHAAGIDVGDAPPWVCVGATPDGSDTVREFPAHTPGLRQLVAGLRQGGVTTVALEASGVYGHVLFLTLLEEGFAVGMPAPAFPRQIKGRPKTDRRDCQWIQRRHQHGLLPSIFQPDAATHSLRDYVRQRANHVRLSGQHIQRLQKALELMNLQLTKGRGDVTGVTGLKLIRALVHGQRDPEPLAKLRDRRCQHTAAAIAQALDGPDRPEHVLELKRCLTRWEQYQKAIAQLDTASAGPLRQMQTTSALPPLPPKPRVRGRQPHDPGFDVRTALDYRSGVELTAIEGIDELHALTLVSELGTDFSKWPTVKQFTSWLGLCPNGKKTGAKVKSSPTRTGKNRAAHALRRAAWSLMRSTSYLGAYLRRQRSRRGAPKAIPATAHKLARMIYNRMRYGVAYLQQTEAAYAEPGRQRLENQLQRRAQELGYELKKLEGPAAAATP